MRTLHYYDDIHLLKPSRRTNHGRRFYSEDDLLTLQQIMTLKLMDFSLSQIKQIIQKNTLDLFESLKMQAKALAEKAERLQKVSHFLHNLIEQHESEKTIRWEMIAEIIKTFTLKEKDKKAWL